MGLRVRGRVRVRLGFWLVLGLSLRVNGLGKV